MYISSAGGPDLTYSPGASSLISPVLGSMYFLSTMGWPPRVQAWAGRQTGKFSRGDSSGFEIVGGLSRRDSSGSDIVGWLSRDDSSGLDIIGCEPGSSRQSVVAEDWREGEIQWFEVCERRRTGLLAASSLAFYNVHATFVGSLEPTAAYQIR
jgi:hypothetical protein